MIVNSNKKTSLNNGNFKIISNDEKIQYKKYCRDLNNAAVKYSTG